MKHLIAVCLLLGTLAACAPSTDPRPVGAGRDAHGCIGSAGYTWSTVRGECLRVFEAGLAFVPDPAPTQGPALAAYLVLAPAQGDVVTAAEVFVPGRAAPVALALAHTPEGDVRPTLLINRAEGIEVFRHKDEHYLDVQGQRFRRESPASDRLFQLR